MRVGWGELDPNGHMRSSAYSDMAATARVHYMDDRGFPPATFAKFGIGPVLFEEHLIFHREAHFGEELEVVMWVAEISEDGLRVTVEHELRKAADTVAAQVQVVGGWFSLGERKLVPPPEGLSHALAADLAGPRPIDAICSPLRHR